MTSVDATERVDSFREVIRIDEGQIKSHVDQVVRESVEQTLNARPGAEAEALYGAKRYKRSPTARTRGPAATSARSRLRPAR